MQRLACLCFVLFCAATTVGAFPVEMELREGSSLRILQGDFESVLEISGMVRMELHESRSSISNAVLEVNIFERAGGALLLSGSGQQFGEPRHLCTELWLKLEPEGMPITFNDGDFACGKTSRMLPLTRQRFFGRGLIYTLDIVAEPVDEVKSTLFLRGDPNSDGRHDISDPILVLTDLFVTPGVLDCSDGADANDDGAVDIADAVFLLNYHFLAGGAPSRPFIYCGPDLTLDEIDCDEAPYCRL